MTDLSMFRQTRKLIGMATKGLPEEAYFTIPDKFDNNIAWNLGHIIVVQQALIYGRSGLEMSLEKGQAKLFRQGTSPADWGETRPDITALRKQLREHVDLFEADMAADKFQAVEPYTTSTGVSLNTFADCYNFNNFHEGLHLGQILALRNLVL